jgi:PPK2 family polyphosphate:nucleotide phosphotransferase
MTCWEIEGKVSSRGHAQIPLLFAKRHLDWHLDYFYSDSERQMGSKHRENRGLIGRYRVRSGSDVELNSWDSDDTSGCDGNEARAQARFAALTQDLGQLQDRLYAGHEHKLLIVLQAMDTGGKDGTIRKVFQDADPQGLRVVSFKVPNAEEREYDYLWRVHKQVPRRGEMVIFNRSHYEDVVTARVHRLVSARVWARRFSQINDFERMLSEEGVIIIKFFLHISKREQKSRLQARLDDADKRWKFNPDSRWPRSW